MMMNPSKQRGLAAFFLGLLALVGIGYRTGIEIPLISQAVIFLVQLLLAPLSAAVVKPSILLLHIFTYKGHIVWCVASAWLGLAAWLWATREDASEDIWKIISWYYLFMPLVISSSVFALCYFWDPDFQGKFYSASFALGLVLGFSVKQFWSLVQSRR